MDFLSLAKARYSCRKFSSKPVEKEKIDAIIEAAIAAPTAKNVQPFRLWIIEGSDALEKVRSTTPCHFDANVIIAVGSKEEGAFVRPSDNENFADVDASIVGTHIMLQVHALGLGTTWVGFFDAPKLKELFPDMADFNMVALFPIGYPADDAAPSDRHEKRKPAAELVTRL